MLILDILSGVYEHFVTDIACFLFVTSFKVVENLPR